jgi:hypothetical protein
VIGGSIVDQSNCAGAVAISVRMRYAGQNYNRPVLVSADDAYRSPANLERLLPVNSALIDIDNVSISGDAWLLQLLDCFIAQQRLQLLACQCSFGVECVDVRFLS